MSKGTLVYLGRYRLLNLVNTGQTSQMWQAYDDSVHQFFAVKTLQEKFRKSREHASYLKREYAVGSKLDHPRIIHVFEYGTDRGAPYVAMEWFAAPNMKQRLRMGVETYAHHIPKIVLQATEALSYFNGHGWVHRDIKPDNFLVADDGEVRLIDFALAQRSRGVLGRLIPVRSKVQGTRSYMSPEQIRGEGLDERSDLYSLACTLFELVGGRPPYTGTSSDELLTKHLRAAPPSLEASNRNVTPEFAQLIRRAMAKKRSARFKSVTEFYDALQEIRVFRENPLPPVEGAKPSR